MKKIALAAAAVSLLSMGAASAADMAPRYTKAPVMMEEVWSWTGFYVGGFVGGAWDRETAVSSAFPSPGFGAPAVIGAGLAGFGFLPTGHDLRHDGFTAGGYAGYNWQAASWVLGVEGDFAYIDRNGANTQPLIETFSNPAGGNTRALLTISNDNRWLGSLRGRIGYTWGHAMLYATGGAAFRNNNDGNSISVVPVGFGLNGSPGGVGSFNNHQVGYAVGVGGEWMVSQNWMLRAEYLRYGFQGRTGTVPILGDTCTVAVNCRFVVNSSDQNIDTVRVGLAYKFGGPVVARY